MLSSARCISSESVLVIARSVRSIVKQLSELLPTPTLLSVSFRNMLYPKSSGRTNELAILGFSQVSVQKMISGLVWLIIS